MGLTASRLLGLWDKCQRRPAGVWLFNHLLGRLIPYTGSVGARVQTLSAGVCEVQLVERRRIKNHLGSIHAIALANLGELATGLAVFSTLPDDIRGIVTNLDIHYHKKARGTLLATSRANVPDISEAIDYQVEGHIHDNDGDLVATITVTWRLAPKQ